MIKFNIDDNVFYIKVLGKIEKGDFENNLKTPADHIIAEYGKIRGIIIDGTDFDGWADFPALLEHFGFVQEINEHVDRVAIIGDHTWQKLLPPIASLFVEPVIKRFDPGHGEAAEEWIKTW